MTLWVERFVLYLGAPRVPKKLVHYPSEDEMAKLLGGQFMGPFPERDRLILELLYGAGVRVDELCGIRLDDFREHDQILVRGKGKKERFVLFGECTQDALAAYMPVRADLLARKRRETKALFFGLTGSELEGLTVRTVNRIVKSAARAQGLPERHPHAFRHAFATHMIDRGASIVIVSRLLGHTNLSTTERYTHISSGRILQAYNAAHPHGSPTARVTEQPPPERPTFNLYATANDAIAPKQKEKQNAH